MVARVANATAPRVAVTTAAQSAARDRRAMDDGVPSRALMRSAGQAAAAEIARRYAGRLSRGVTVFVGPGHNGGDGWVVAASLAASGVRVHVVESGPPRAADTAAERERALPLVVPTPPSGAERLVIDAVLGTGARETAEGDVADAIRAIRAAKRAGATVVSLDLPSGLVADDGSGALTVEADCTLTFGTAKRGLLLRRDLAGTVVVLDIGLGTAAQLGDDAAGLVDAAWVRAVLPRMTANAHKGTRGKLAIVGGAAGMAGAVVLGARAALASGAGMVKVVTEPSVLDAVVGAVPAALSAPWPADDSDAAAALRDWADAVVVGPGLGAANARAITERVAKATPVPLVIDADALNAFAGDLPALAAVARERAVLTPHAGEAARLLGRSAQEITARCFDVAQELADVTDTVVLLKGVPTVVCAPGGAPFVVARGTPSLATAGSGDVLAGIIATLLAQGVGAVEAAAAAAWAHGVAAERAGDQVPLRGVTLEDVLVALPTVWDLDVAASLPPVLAELPAVPA
jgi:NAD(P)H-hydrate epimerase